MRKIFALTFFAFFSLTTNSLAQDCILTNDIAQRILNQVNIKNPEAIKALPDCFKNNRKLALKVALADHTQFEFFDNSLKEDENFVRRLLKINPQLLKFISPKLRSDESFMEYATYLDRDALQYAQPELLDNKLFIKKMIGIDSRNYIYASSRLKEISEFAAEALKDNGLLLSFAPDKIRGDKNLVKIALNSNAGAFEFISDELKKDKDLQQLGTQKTSIKSLDELRDFLRKNYLVLDKKKNLGFVIGNKAKFFPKSKIIDRNYVTKWQRLYNQNGDDSKQNLRLITVDSRNYPPAWKADVSKHSDLIKKIEKFFLKHNLDQNTIDNLTTTQLWKIKSNPLTIALNFYLLRENDDVDLGNEFCDVTALTTIMQKQKDGWHFSVVEVIFDKEIRVNLAFENGHKNYVVWDLYQVDKNDKNPKIIFKVEDKFSEYFEVFEEQNGGKYQMILRFDPFLKNEQKDN